MNKGKRHAHLAVLALLVLGQVGCASVPRLSQEVRSQLGVIGVVSAVESVQPMLSLTPSPRPWWRRTYDEPLTYDKPATSAASGVVQGTVEGFLKGVEVFREFAIVLAPFFMAAQAYHRALTAVPAEVMEQAEAALKTAVAESKTPQATGDHLVELIRTRTERQVVRITDPGSCTSWNWWGRRIDDCHAYIEGVKERLDTVLEIRSGVRLESTLGNPNLRLRTRAHVRLIRVNPPAESSPQPTTADRWDPHTRSGDSLWHLFSHQGEARAPFTKWAENDAELFRRELTRSIEALGGQIVDALFCSNSSSPCKEPIREAADESLEKKAGQAAERSGDVEDQPAPGEGTDERSKE